MIKLHYLTVFRISPLVKRLQTAYSSFLLRSSSAFLSLILGSDLRYYFANILGNLCILEHYSDAIANELSCRLVKQEDSRS